jgi:outer membrane autotransporter protein
VQGQIINNGMVGFYQTFTGTYAGNMSGSGSVTVSSALPVTFTGINSYTGGTTVASGSTLIGDTRSLQGTMFNSGLIQFNQSTIGTYAGVISGVGGVEVSGLGTTTFSSDNIYTGGTTIDNSGTLIVAGSILGNVSINNGGTLMGSGTVGATTVNAGGTIAPGHVGSPLTINGNFVQGGGSTYTAEVNATGSDKIAVNGTAQIGTATKLNLNIDPGTLTVGKHYELLSATGGLTGQYATVLTPPLTQNILFTEQYGANNLLLVVNSNLSSSALSSNQLAIASVFDRSSGTATGDYANAITQLTTLGPAPLAAALNQFSGNIYGSIGTIERQTTTVQLQLLSNRLASLSAPSVTTSSLAQRTSGIRLVSRQASDEQLSGASTSEPSASRNWTTWAQGYGLGGSVAGDSNAGGSNYRLGGTLFGTERWLNENLMIGVLGGYAGTSISNRQDSSHAQVNGYQVGLYELYRQDSYYISNIDAYSNSSYDVTRPLDVGNIQKTASGSSSGNQWAHYTEGGLTYEIDEFRVQPFLGFQYMYLNQQGYTESGAGSLDLTTGSQIINSVRNSIGARVYHETMWGQTLVIPSLSARYQHEWGNGTQLISSSFSGAPTLQFTTAGNHTGRDFGLFTLGATAYLTPRFNLYGSVDTQVALNYSAIIGSGGIQYSW